MKNNNVLVALLVVLTLGVGFFIGRFTAPSGVVYGGKAVSENSGSSSPTVAAVSAANLNDGQRKMLAALGINADEIVITEAMVACAEAKLGAQRMEEIKNGATPSFSEGAKLVACYR